MTKVTFVESDGNVHELEVENGLTLMEAAVDNMIPGIDAECGGACACATCHVYVDAGWANKIGEIGQSETIMLEHAAHRKGNSRLSCQIVISDALDGLRVTIPESQF
ncbi:2Fe-2S ferredoxin [Rhizorhabdus dicambivorans]|uniref:DsmB n=1 Tax=Rhizorhabdus dicambivorans TaxID=1850238 RepID=A0A2H4ZC44_9SPHN|nr:2Fe-2S iron-sulfur cluster-binding protein [Rhizorhabdus dicambivorans]ATE65233.1 2Fe-2S ferredoxin [Rhizorhabdus dicambivorans]AUF73407.1 DsmB [Rhizorhabdus dicambivorans]